MARKVILETQVGSQVTHQMEELIWEGHPEDFILAECNQLVLTMAHHKDTYSYMHRVRLEYHEDS